MLPDKAENQERLEWLAAAIRSYKGSASVVKVGAFDDLSDKDLQQLFVDARTRDYQDVAREVRKLLSVPAARRPAGRLTRLRRRFQEIEAIDFFPGPARSQLESLFAKADRPEAQTRNRTDSTKYANRIWITRSRPGIDRVSSAWLIRRFIDPKARFVFGDDPARKPEAIPFDMFVPQGFGHRGDNCTFETLCREFTIRDKRVKKIAEIIHDADLGDEKFGREEGTGLDQVLRGWAGQGVEDAELLRRGIDLIEGLYVVGEQGLSDSKAPARRKLASKKKNSS